MSQHTDWTVEPRARGWLARLIAPQEGDRPSSMPVLLGGLGAAAYVAALALDWQKLTVAPLASEGPSPQVDVILTAGLGDTTTLSLAFVLGGIALLALIGTVATRPQVALRLRMTTMGVGVGLIGVLLAITIRMPNTYLAVQGFAEAIFGGSPEAVQDRMTHSYEPGIFFGYAAVILPLLGVWLAGRPAARSVGRRLTLADEEPSVAGDGGPPAEIVVRRVPRPDGPLDLTVTSEGPVQPR